MHFLIGKYFASASSSSGADILDEELARLLAPAPSTFLGDVRRDTLEGMRTTVSDNISLSKNIAKGLYQGDWSILVSETIHLALAHLAGRKDVVIFGKRGADFEEISLNKCVEGLISTAQKTLMRSLNRDNDHYGVVRSSGEIVDIYRNRTFFQMVIDAALPREMPLRGVLMSLAGNSLIENIINTRIRTLALETVTTLLNNRGLTLREASGQLVVGTIKHGADVVRSALATQPTEATTSIPQSSSSSSSQSTPAWRMRPLFRNTYSVL